MKKFVFFLLVILLTLSYLAGQGTNTANDDQAAIARAALDYIEGYYEVNAARMERALSPSLTKRGLIFSPRSHASFLQPINAEALIEVTRAGWGRLPAEQRQIDYRLLDISGHTASARVFSAKVKDYLHLAKQNGQWRIVNVLWRLPAEATSVARETANKESEVERIRMLLEEFREAMRKGNYERVQRILHPASVFHVLNETGEPGKLVLQERNADSIIDRTKAGNAGAIPDFRITVDDVFEDIAAARVVRGNSTQYLHLARQDNEWRIVNSLQEQPLAPAAGIEPAELGQKMANFTLASVNGKDVSLAGLAGKNVLLVFPRGRVGDHWCQICHYQYAELADLERRLQLRKKYNLEIVFVLPYDRATVEHWVAIFPEQMAVIEKWKNPGDPKGLSDGDKRWMETSRLAFPKKFAIGKENIPTPFPILIDNERTVSRGLDLFTLLWDNSRVEQNIPAVYLLDRHGKVLFNYLSQNTMDRPSGDQLLELFKKFL
ncbi:MAG: nuclear transport factor 2 family protein [Candidatus Aminicenantes bacterium]|nr:nuclear transport factor 2 family protein [Candidatus Aminicenantes bacterium]